MSTASLVPETRDMELEGDEAVETLRAVGRRRLAIDAFQRFRAADGFSHSRALGLQFALTLLPALVAVVGFATALDQEGFTRVVEATLDDLAPGVTADLLTEALRQGTRSSRESGEDALAAGLIAALLAGTTAMGQLERGANRLYGVERDRPPLRKYGVALGLVCTAGTLTVLAFVVLVGGDAIRRSVGWGGELADVWAVARWPLGVALVIAAVALLFEASPRRHQPEPSWLAFGSGLAAVLWLAFTALLAVYLSASGGFGATYGPIAGTIGLLLWTFLSALALLLGLAVAAQLEAVRAGAPGPRVEREANV